MISDEDLGKQIKEICKDTDIEIQQFIEGMKKMAVLLKNPFIQETLLRGVEPEDDGL